MKEQQEHIDDLLLLKVLEERANADEMMRFGAWLDASAENAEYYAQLLRTQDLSKVKVASVAAKWKTVAASYEKKKQVPEYIELPKNKTKVISLPGMLRIAAALLVLLGLSVLFRNIVVAPQQLHISGIDLEHHEAYALADGSRVFMNGDATISFSKKFGAKNRDLILQGEAFFEVEPNRQLPFVIHTHEATVQVTGTSFNVYSDSTRKVQISVVTGSVDFFIDKQHGVSLKAGEQGSFDPATGRIEKGMITDPNFQAWKTGILLFDETPVQQAFETLQNQYKQVMVFEEAPEKTLTLTTTFDNAPMEAVLEELNLLLNTIHENRNDTIIFKTN